jgi:plastocyanin
MKRILAVLAIAPVLLLAACGGGDSEPAAPAAAAKAAGGATVRMVDNAFDAPSITVAVGDTVTWTNAGAAPHTATADEFDSGTVAPGETFTWTAEEPGTVTYLCTFHPGMEGTITVR